MQEKIDTIESDENEISAKPNLFDRLKNFTEDNKPEIGFLIIVLIITFFVFYYFTIYPRQQQGQISNINLENKCTIEAKKFFNNIQGKVNSINYTYKNHYSTSLGRCYILIHGIGVGETGMSDILIDVFDNKEVANCESYTTAPEIDFCSYDGTILKYDINQFNNFIKPYMEIE